MRILFFLLRKEFRQIFRDFAIVRTIFFMPIMQLMILPQVANFELKNANFVVVDHDHSSQARHLIDKLSSVRYFTCTGYVNSFDEARTLIELGTADFILEVPHGFEQMLMREQSVTVGMSVNAINGVKANLGAIYAQSVIREWNQDIRLQIAQPERFQAESSIRVVATVWYNVFMQYSWFMVPGIMMVLLAMVGLFLTALNIVKEKEIGTIEQINVTPIKKWQFIVGKLLPFWLIGLVLLSISLVVSRVVYQIIPVGTLVAIYVFAGVFLLAMLGLGLLLSTLADTQQQAMLLAFFFIMVFMLLGGLYTSIDSMPEWTQWMTRVNPIAYGIKGMRMLVIKGSTLYDVLPELSALLLYAIIINLLAVWNYRKTT
jgi:ABC-2 type transport system permease protein